MKYVASSISQMTDYDKYYVYTGHEEGMVTGCWYFWSGTEWLIGGDYQCGIDDIIETSSTMDEEGMPADAKAVGDMIVVSNTEPTSPHTELWIDPDTESVLVPTMDDIEGTYAKKSEVESTYARKAAVGSPLRAATASAMTDVTKIYVYTGSESGYTSGHWYYYDGSSWADGGVYNSTAFVTDKTLTGDGEAADAKVTGDEITNLKSAVNSLDSFCRKEVETVFSNNKTVPSTGMVSENHIIDCVIPAGTTYSIIINDPNGALGSGSFTLYVGSSDSQFTTYSGIVANTTYEFTTNVEIIAFSMYKSTTTGGTITVNVSYATPTENSLEERIDTEEKNVVDIYNKIDVINQFVTEEKCPNFTNPDLAYGGSINNNTGVITPSSDPYYKVSAKIECTPGETIYIYYSDNGTMKLRKSTVDKVAFYEQDGTFISIGYNEDSYTVPQDATYLVQQAPYQIMNNGVVGVFKQSLQALGDLWINYSDPTKHLKTDKTLSHVNEIADANAVGNIIGDTTDNYFKKYGDVVVAGNTSYVEKRYVITDFVAGYDYLIMIDSITGTEYANHLQIHLRNTSSAIYHTDTIRESENIRVSVRPTEETTEIILDFYPRAGGTAGTNVVATYSNVRIIENDFVEKINLKPTINLFDDLEVPSYYFEDSYIQNKADYIKREYTKVIDSGQGDGFIFITDTHWPENQQKSPSIIKYIKNRAFIPRLFHGGDLDRTDVNEEYVEIMKSAYNGETHYVVGNHELYYPTSTGGQAFIQLSAGKNNQIGNTKRNYYYVDNFQDNIRYVVLSVYDAPTPNDGDGAVDLFEDTQKNWLQNVALDVPDDFSVIIFVHYVVGYLGYYDSIALAISNVVDTAKENGTDIICLFTGHGHYDGLFNTTGGVPIVMTTCDKNMPWIKNGTNMEPWMNARVSGTINEQAFDVVLVDRANEYIKAIRVGYPSMDCYVGSTTDDFYDADIEERIVHYNKIDLSGSTTVTPMITPVSWESSNTSVCTISNGTVTEVGNGIAYVSAKSSSGELESWIISVG